MKYNTSVRNALLLGLPLLLGCSFVFFALNQWLVLRQTPVKFPSTPILQTATQKTIVAPAATAAITLTLPAVVSENTPTAQPVNFIEYLHPTGAFALQAPSDWTKTESAHAVEFYSQAQQIRLIAEFFATDNTRPIKELAESAVRNKWGNFANFHLGELREANGVSQEVFFTSSDGALLGGLAFVDSVQNVLFVRYFSYPLNNLPTIYPTLSEMVSSFRIDVNAAANALKTP